MELYIEFKLQIVCQAKIKQIRGGSRKLKSGIIDNLQESNALNDLHRIY